MSEIGSISVSINGDASGLLSAAASAQSAITSLNSAVNGLKSQNVSLNIAAVDNATPVVSAATAAVNAFGGLNPSATISANDDTAAGVASAQAAINSVHDKTVTITVQVNQVGSIPKFASGTASAPRGLARINDEKGVKDPRELVYHGGNYYLFEGRDILIPLDRGDRVFTAAQTKNIMKLNGVKSYASGKKNELYDMDKRLVKHNIKTSNVSLSDQISAWQLLLNDYAYDSEAVMECEEEIFSLTKKLVKEINGISEVYVDERSKLNDWEKFGDSAIDAFGRIRDRNFELLNDGVITWEDYCKTLDEIGANMYEERIRHSENWLKQEYKYNEMSAEDYIAGLDRMAAYTEEYYKNGLIGDVDYFNGMQSIKNQKADMQKKANEAEYNSWKKSASGYKKQRDVYEDWDDWGDSLIKYYNRCIVRQQEFFEAGKIDWETYNDAVINYKMEMYKAEKKEAEAAYKTLLNYANDYIAKIKAGFSAEKDDLDYEFKKSKIDREFGKAAQTRVYYRGAVTQKGKDVYTEASEKLSDLGYEREKLEMTREQSQIMAALKQQYSEIESSKSVIVSKILENGIDVNGILESVSAEFSAGQSNICALLTQLISAVKNGGGTIYGGTTYNISGADYSFVGPLLQRSAAALSGRY